MSALVVTCSPRDHDGAHGATPNDGNEMSSDSPKRTTVAVPIYSLHGQGSSAKGRAARAIAERLVLEPSLEMLAISEPIFHYGELIFEAWDLASWLAEHRPAVATSEVSAVDQPVETNPAPRNWASELKRPLTRRRARHLATWAREIVRSPKSSCLRLLKTTLEFELLSPARRAWRVMRGGGAPPAFEGPLPIGRVQRGENTYPDGLAHCVGQTSRFVSMRDFEALVSFGCDDAIWDWPLERYDCKTIGFFHDAAPLRIQEGGHTDVGLFFRSVAKMTQRADWIVCASKSAENDLHVFFPLSRPKTRVVHHGHDWERFAADHDVEAPVSRTSSPPTPGQCDAVGAQRERKIAMIVEPEAGKNLSAVLRACWHIAAARPGERAVLTLIGRMPDPNSHQWLEREAARFVDVRYLGHVADEWSGDVLRSCDVFVDPSLWSGCGTAVLEAMTAGVPVVCAENSSLTEIGGDYVFCCDRYDPASIASAVCRALTLSDEDREQWVADARRWARQFTWANTTRHLVQLLHEPTATRRSATAWRPPLTIDPLSHAA